MDDLTEKGRYNLLEKEIKFRRLAIGELDPEMLLPFQRYQEVNRVWRVIDGERKLVSEPFVDNWDDETKVEIVEQDFKHCLLGGGQALYFCSFRRRNRCLLSGDGLRGRVGDPCGACGARAVRLSAGVCFRRGIEGI